MAPPNHSLQERAPKQKRAPARAALPALLTACATLFGSPTLVAAAEDAPVRTSSHTGSDAPVAGRLDRMLADADAAYRARRWSLALEGLNAIVALEPDHAQAWLRIGNVHQQRRQWLSAASAYRKAARRDDAAGGADQVTRAKALINLASVNVELANAALAEVNRLPAGSLPDPVLRAKDEVTASANRARDAAARAGVTDPLRGDDERNPGARKSGDAVRGARAATARGSTPGATPGATPDANPGVPPARLEIEYLRGAPKP